MVSGCIQRLSDLMVYETSKRVRIRDPALGILRFALLFLAVLYLFVWVLWYNQGYLEFLDVKAVVQTSLKGPAAGVGPATSQRYCHESPYEYAAGKLGCVAHSADEWVQAPSNGGQELFIATRVKDKGTAGEVKAYVLDPESYTIGISFTLISLKAFEDSKGLKQKYSQTLGQRQWPTRLLDREGNELDVIVRKDRFDIITLHQFMAAGGVNSLDEAHARHENAAVGETIRYNGIVLVVDIACTNGAWGEITGCDYRVWPLQASEAEVFVTNDVQMTSSTSVQERRGVKLLFVTSAKMGRFSLMGFLLSVVGASTGLAMTSLVINTVMVYFLPHKRLYFMMMTEESVNFQDVRIGKPHALVAVEELEVEHMKMRGEVPTNRRFEPIGGLHHGMSRGISPVSPVGQQGSGGSTLQSPTAKGSASSATASPSPGSPAGTPAQPPAAGAKPQMMAPPPAQQPPPQKGHAAPPQPVKQPPSPAGHVVGADAAPTKRETSPAPAPAANGQGPRKQRSYKEHSPSPLYDIHD